MSTVNAYERAQEFNTSKTTTNNAGNRPSGILSKAVGDNEPYSLNVTPIAFDVTTESKLVTTLDLAANVNAVFRKVFRDYDGCNIVLDPNQNRWKAVLYFRENVNIGTEGAVANITPLASKVQGSDGKPSIGRRLEGITLLQSNIHYSLTKETTDVLQKYYLPWEKEPKSGFVNWKRFLTEQSDPSPYGYSSAAIYVCVSGIDVVELLKDIYGNKNEEDHWVDYSITAIRPITQYQVGSTNLLLGIQRIDCDEVKNLYSKIGAIQPHGAIPIIRQ